MRVVGSAAGRALVLAALVTLVACSGDDEFDDVRGPNTSSGADETDADLEETLDRIADAVADDELVLMSCDDREWGLTVVDRNSGEAVASVNSVDSGAEAALAPGQEVLCGHGMFSPDLRRLALSNSSGQVGWLDLLDGTVTIIGAGDESFSVSGTRGRAPRFDAEGRLWYHSDLTRFMWADEDAEEVHEGGFSPACGFNDQGFPAGEDYTGVVGDAATACSSVHPSGLFAPVETPPDPFGFDPSSVPTVAPGEPDPWLRFDLLDQLPPSSSSESGVGESRYAWVFVDDADAGDYCRPVAWAGDDTLICGVEDDDDRFSYRALEVDPDAVTPGGALRSPAVSPPLLPRTDRTSTLLQATDRGDLVILASSLGEPARLYLASIDSPGEEPQEIGPFPDNVGGVTVYTQGPPNVSALDWG